MAGAPSSSNDAHGPLSHDIELQSVDGPALSDGGLPSGPGKDRARLLEQQEPSLARASLSTELGLGLG